MIPSDMEEQLRPLRMLVKEQGDKIREMKTTGAAEIDIKKEVLILKSRKKELEDAILNLSPKENFDRAKMADLIKRRFFYDISFAIYGGITGQYDFGPMGSVIVDNMINEWQKHFVVQERMLKINCSILTPEPVLKASGHVDKFADYMVKDKDRMSVTTQQGSECSDSDSVQLVTSDGDPLIWLSSDDEGAVPSSPLVIPPHNTLNNIPTEEVDLFPNFPMRRHVVFSRRRVLHKSAQTNEPLRNH